MLADMLTARNALALLLAAALVGCSSGPKPTYKMSPREVDAKLRTLAATTQPAPLPERVVALARQNIGQPYDLYLLGEAPFEMIDPQPVYNLQKSDCVVFVEHTLAMALSPDFPSFLHLLERIRYINGEIGVRTRNHYTEADWNTSNTWLMEEITDQIAGDRVGHYVSRVDRQKFFKKRYKLDVPSPVQKLPQTYVPDDQIASIKSQLRTGDVFESIKGPTPTDAWAHHLGFIAVTPEGEVHMIHSNTPRVLEQPIDDYIAKTEKREAKQATTRPSIPRHRGFKFFRLHDDALARLKAIDGDATPRVTVPADSPISFDDFVAQVMAGSSK